MVITQSIKRALVGSLSTIMFVTCALSGCSRNKNDAPNPASPESPTTTVADQTPRHEDTPTSEPPTDGQSPSTATTGGATRIHLKVRLGDETSHAVQLSWQDVKPILDASCIGCHGATGISPQLHSWDALGTDAASRAVVLGRVIGTIQAGTMPPPVIRDRVDAGELALLQSWTQAGSPLSIPEINSPAVGYAVQITWSDGSSQIFSLDEQGSVQIDAPSLDFTWQLIDADGAPASQPSTVSGLRATGGSTSVQLSTRLTPVLPPGPSPLPSPIPSPMPSPLPSPVPTDMAAPVFAAAPSSSALTDRSVNLTWEHATDLVTASENLEYQVLAGERLEDLASTAAVVVRPWQIGSLRVAIKGLLPSRSYQFIVLARDAAGNIGRSDPVTVTTRAADPNENYDIVTYAKECSERLGRLPAFNCLDGEIIKIEVDGEVPSHGYPEFAGDSSGNLDCDKPAHLAMGNEGRCMPWARLGRLPSIRADGTTHPDVDTVFICRRYNGRDGSYRWRDGQTYDARVFPGFEDVAVIQHNRVTGETCWFQMLDSTAKDARRVPPPDEEQLPSDAPSTALSARTFWLSPQRTAAINCLSCHDSDPWIHTPYVAQVKDRNGRPILPSHPFGPYKNMGRKYFTDWLTANRQSFSVAPREANSCVSCHRIGSKNTCGNFAAQSIGAREAAGMSAWARENFGLSTWMPPQIPGAPTSHAEWFADMGGYRSAAEKLIHCCQNPDSVECQERTPINTAPPPFAAP